ncbi:MAG: ATP-dependent helicase HrpB [Sphingomonadales bacterium]|nr:ATP-dependent helicase HrpB [Sphingomonadales bacterium]
MTLPIHAVLPELLNILRASSNAVLVAPPGAGKTTAVAPALLDEDWCSGKILLLSPRRIAARAAAERMAELRGERVGETIGYATRMDSKRSGKTRILVVTEGIFRNRIQADPELAGVSAVLFDEVHERSLDCDAGLAFALDAQSGLRPDLRLLAMSATLDGTRFATLMNAPVIESEGRAWPLEVRYSGRTSDRIEDAMAAAIRSAMATEQGSLLAFLPGVAEIERTAEGLDRLPADVAVHKLYGALDPAAQRAAIAPGSSRKVVLATSIAETSLTIDGVRIVIDSGLARRPRYDRSAGLTRLVTERASQAAVTQRAGRAARQGPGLAVRLWEEAATGGLPRFDPPEILEADLSALMLDCAIWGVTDPRTLRWIDPPPDSAIAEARGRLLLLGAIDADGRPTLHGKAIAAVPLPPRLSHMLIAAEDRAQASEVAMLLTERGLGGPDTDIDSRLSRWRGDRGKRADAARSIARRWAGDARRGVGGAGECIALAFPDRVAKRRSGDGADWISVGGRGFRLDPTSSLARAEWLAVAETQGSAAGARIVSAAALTFAEVESIFADTIATNDHLKFDPATGTVTARRERRLGSITLNAAPFDAPREAVANALVEGVRTHGLSVLNLPESARAFQARAGFANVSGLDDATLIEHLDNWLPDLTTNKRRLSDIDPGALIQSWLNLLDWSDQQAINTRAPREFLSPAGTHHAIDYAASAGPTVELRVQALFGIATHPTIGNGVPLVLSLTSPGAKPIQTTRDLPGFWKGSWADVVKEMRGRYPRHNWPDDPTGATASLKTKNALARQR